MLERSTDWLAMPSLRRPTDSQPAWCVMGMVLLTIVSNGCQQGQRIRASRLPAELMAPPLTSLQKVDLSRIARANGDSNLLEPGDLVEVTIATGLEEQDPPRWRGRVGQDGNVDVPLVGKVQLAGLEPTQAEQVVRAESIRRGKFVDPNVTLVRTGRRSNRVTVVGAVKTPGTYELPSSGSDVLSALVMAGGLTEESGTLIELRHPARRAALAAPGSPQFAGYNNAHTMVPPRTMQIDLERAHEVAPEDLHLGDGSTVMVMPRPERFIHVIGLVKAADQFEIPENQELRLLDALALAGGRTLSIADKVQVIRTIPGRIEPIVITASVREAKGGSANIRLAAGDVVSVEETPTTFVVGTLREFIRFGFTSAIPGL